MLGLPDEVRACLFDLDGVLTETAKLHAAAWKQLFDAYLQARAQRLQIPFVAFDAVEDYDRAVDGKPREAGVRAFLATRGIQLPEGRPDDPPGAETVNGLAAQKNRIVLGLFRERGVFAYQGSVRYVRAVRSAGLRTAVVSSSRNCREVTEVAGIADLFDARIDGISLETQQLRGKPAPDTFLAAASALAVPPEHCAVFEDAIAGVQAGKAGHFRWVVGVARRHDAAALRAQGADVVVQDLSALMEAP